MAIGTIINMETLQGGHRYFHVGLSQPLYSAFLEKLHPVQLSSGRKRTNQSLTPLEIQASPGSLYLPLCSATRVPLQGKFSGFHWAQAYLTSKHSPLLEQLGRRLHAGSAQEHPSSSGPR